MLTRPRLEQDLSVHNTMTRDLYPCNGSSYIAPLYLVRTLEYNGMMTLFITEDRNIYPRPIYTGYNMCLTIMSNDHDEFMNFCSLYPQLVNIYVSDVTPLWPESCRVSQCQGKAFVVPLFSPLRMQPAICYLWHLLTTPPAQGPINGRKWS